MVASATPGQTTNLFVVANYIGFCSYSNNLEANMLCKHLRYLLEPKTSCISCK